MVAGPSRGHTVGPVWRHITHPLVRAGAGATVLRPVRHRPSRSRRILDEVLSMPAEDVVKAVDDVVDRLSRRHQAGEVVELAMRLSSGVRAEPARRMLYGLCHLSEYAVDGAAATNPSMFRHPSSGWVMSVRAIGEGHLSHIVFRSLAVLGGRVSARGDEALVPGRVRETRRGTMLVAFPHDTPMTRQAIGPTPTFSLGLEDARFCVVDSEDVLATATGWDGQRATACLLSQRRPNLWTVTPLRGDGAADKGLSLFPQRFDGRLLGVARVGEGLSLVEEAGDGRFEPAASLRIPRRPWSVVQIGPSGSPIRTERGWLLVYHGVGPGRVYSLGLALLDPDDPGEVTSVRPDPVLQPDHGTPPGYVPHVVYTCGAATDGEWLYLPYGVDDRTVGVASAPIREVLSQLP